MRISSPLRRVFSREALLQLFLTGVHIVAVGHHIYRWFLVITGRPLPPGL